MDGAPILIVAQPDPFWRIALYACAVLLLGVAAFTLHRMVTAWRLGLLATLVFLATLVYLASLIPGALAAFNMVGVTITLAILVAALVAIATSLCRLATTERNTTDTVPSVDWSRWHLLEIVLAGIALYDCRRLFSLVVESVLDAFNPQCPLTVDVVSYHLPGFIEYWQAGSLYSLDGPFQTYGYAYELIGNLPGHYFQSHWGAVVAHIIMLFLFGLALWKLAMRVTQLFGIHRGATRVLAFLIALVITKAMFLNDLHFAGKNDCFAAACVVTTLIYTLEIVDPARTSLKRVVMLAAVSTASLSLAIAAKPTALVYLPLIPLAIAVARPGFSRAAALVTSALALAFIGVVGGFFLLRNLVMVGGLASDQVSTFHNLSVVANLTNPALYEPKKYAILYVATLLSLPMLVWGWRRGRTQPGTTIGIALLALAFLAAFIGFALTPVGAFQITLEESDWKPRLGMPLFLLFAVITGATVSPLAGLGATVNLFRVVSAWRDVCRHISPGACRVAVGVIAMTFATIVPLVWHNNPTRGMPGFESLHDLPRSDAYCWVQALEPGQRIYAAGMRPLGLYGKGWRHVLFYDLHSDFLVDTLPGSHRIAAVVIQFHPDFIIMSTDPFTDRGSVVIKPMVEWLRGLNQCFQLTYEDETVAVFRVLPGCAGQMRELMPEGYGLRMTG